MCGRAIGRIVRVTLPIGNRCAGKSFPPGLVVGGDRDIGEDRVARNRAEGGRIAVVARAWCDAEETGFRVDRIQATVAARAHPADVVAYRPYLPAVTAVAF